MNPQLTEVEFFKFMGDIAEELAYHHGIVLVGFSVKQKDGTWLLVVRINKRLDGRKVCFIETETIKGCFEYLAVWCYHSGVPLRWSNDRFA